MKLPFDNPKGAVIIIVAIILLFTAYKCQAAEIEWGSTYTSEFNGGSVVTLTERFGDKVDVGVTLVGEQEWKNVKTENNGLVWFGYVAERPKTWLPVLPSEVTIGAGAWFRDDNMGSITDCHPTFTLALKWRFGYNASLGIRHFSNAGVCDKNRGQDMLVLGWRF